MIGAFNMDYRTEAPEIIKSFLIYHETIKGHSPKTVEEYYLDPYIFQIHEDCPRPCS